VISIILEIYLPILFVNHFANSMQAIIGGPGRALRVWSLGRGFAAES
jgi:hypothetical protein